MSSVTSGITTTITNRFANTASQSVLWGEITGTLGNQTDLQNALNAKVDSVNSLTGTVTLTQDNIPSGATYVQTTNDFTTADKTIVGNAAVKDGTVQTNLNADLLDGYNASAFALSSQVMPMYLTKQSDTSASLNDSQATVNASNYMYATLATSFNPLGSPRFVVTRTTGSTVTLNNTNGSMFNLFISTNVASPTIEFAVRALYSTDAGLTWTPLSTRQSFGAVKYTGNSSYGVLNSVPSSTVIFDAVSGTLTIPAGNLIKYEIYAKASSGTPIVRIYCGVNLSGNNVYSMIKLSLQSVILSSANIENDAITNDKLGTDVKVGSLAALTTTTKTDVVSAINELKAQIAALNAKVGL